MGDKRYSISDIKIGKIFDIFQIKNFSLSRG